MTHTIITGGSSGIGLALACECLETGDRVTLIARSAEGLETARSALSAPDRVGVAACDVTDATALAAAIAGAEEAFGPADRLITSAGIARPGQFGDLDEAVFRDLMEVNYFGTLNAVSAVWPGMAMRGKGQIILIASAAAVTGIFGHTAYAPSKFAVRGFAEALRAEARETGIALSICYPPDTDTPMLTAEAAFKPPETAALSALAGQWSAEDVARLTLSRAGAGQFAIYPGIRTWMLARLAPVVTPIIHRIFDLIARRAGR